MEEMSTLTRATSALTLSAGQDPTPLNFSQRMGKLSLPKVRNYSMVSDYYVEQNLKKAAGSTKSKNNYIPHDVQLVDNATIGGVRLCGGLHAEKFGLSVPLKAELPLLHELLTEHVEMAPKIKMTKADGNNYMYAVLDHETYTTFMETGTLPSYRKKCNQVNWTWTPYEAFRRYAYLVESGWETTDTACVHLVTFKMKHENKLKDFNRHYNEYSKYAMYDMDYHRDVEELGTLTTWAFPTAVAKVWQDLADDFTTPVARDYTAWLNLETVIKDRNYKGDLSPGWEGQDWLKLYYYTMNKLPKDYFDKLVLDLPFAHADTMCKQEKDNLWSAETHKGKASLEVYIDYYSNFQRRAKKGQFTNYTPEQVGSILAYIKDYFEPKYRELLIASKRSRL